MTDSLFPHQTATPTHAEAIRHMATRGKTILVGEDNPYGSDPRYALFCRPTNSAGGRLQRLVLGVSQHDYIRDFARLNLCSKTWKRTEARAVAAEILRLAKPGTSIVLLGSKVCMAFGQDYEPFAAKLPSDGDLTFVILPHPSGRCRAWNEPGAFDRAKAALREARVIS